MAFSPAEQDWAQGGPIAIHGTPEPWTIGDAASHGCSRVENGVLERLFHETPADTPVLIRSCPAGPARSARYRLGMARTRKAQEKDVITRLADAGGDALHRLGDLPSGKVLLEAVAGVRERLDDVATKLRKLDPLERRVSAIEKRLDSLEPKKVTARQATRSKASAPRTATRSKPQPSRRISA